MYLSGHCPIVVADDEDDTGLCGGELGNWEPSDVKVKIL